VPVPRRFDRRPPERDTTRINERIRVPKVRLIGADGEQLGIVEIALLRVRERLRGLDDSDLLSIIANEPDLRYTNPVVDPGLVALWRAPVEPTRDRH